MPANTVLRHPKGLYTPAALPGQNRLNRRAGRFVVIEDVIALVKRIQTHGTHADIHLYNLSMLEATLTIPQEVLDSARMTVADVRLEIAVALYSQRRLSVGKAAQLAELSLWQFRQVLALRQIPPHYDVDDLHQDLKTLQALQKP